MQKAMWMFWEKLFRDVQTGINTSENPFLVTNGNGKSYPKLDHEEEVLDGMW